ncbi:MAG: hypothetical protein A2068_06755 [Ignavibacteria bacterium GWB2_35_6b]|nr:MAG: hypothetical protein A2068_06755 [Ignavibacteria bacterium GWB2_35_6b]
MHNFDGKYISRFILIFLLLSNLFAVNSFYNHDYKRNTSDSNLIFESAAVQDVILSGQKTNKAQFQKLNKSISLEFIEATSISAKHKNFIKISVQHISLLNFQFFLSSQFSTDT